MEGTTPTVLLFNPRTYVAREEGNIICMQDVSCKMRDGVTIYCDIYRPNCAERIPVIISWGFYGKRPGEGMDDWKIMGVPYGAISKMSKHESADPGFWCPHGYAVANVDIRGAGHSEGNLHLFGTRDGLDGYDFIEWIAQQFWCNGKVALYGNSGVAMGLWQIAAAQPPHLTVIAPWEGTSDIYRESVYEGGIFAPDFPEWVIDRTVGTGYIDDVLKMAQEYPAHERILGRQDPEIREHKGPCLRDSLLEPFSPQGLRECVEEDPVKKKMDEDP